MPELTDRSMFDCSKAGGVPSWGQRPVPVDGHVFAAQFNYRIFEMAGPRQYADLLLGGLGYLFLRPQITDGICGYFFIQFT